MDFLLKICLGIVKGERATRIWSFVIYVHETSSVAQKVSPRKSEAHLAGLVAWDNNQKGEGEMISIKFSWKISTAYSVTVARDQEKGQFSINVINTECPGSISYNRKSAMPFR